jgi:hypothetical protein
VRVFDDYKAFRDGFPTCLWLPLRAYLKKKMYLEAQVSKEKLE